MHFFLSLQGNAPPPIYSGTRNFADKTLRFVLLARIYAITVETDIYEAGNAQGLHEEKYE